MLSTLSLSLSFSRKSETCSSSSALTKTEVNLMRSPGVWHLCKYRKESEGERESKITIDATEEEKEEDEEQTREGCDRLDYAKYSLACTKTFTSLVKQLLISKISISKEWTWWRWLCVCVPSGHSTTFVALSLSLRASRRNCVSTLIDSQRH